MYTVFTACCLHKGHNITASIRGMDVSKLSFKQFATFTRVDDSVL